MLQRNSDGTTATRISRGRFVASLAAATTGVWLATRAADAALPLLARLLNPHGINGGVALNAILVTLGLAYLAIVAWLAVRRLRTVGRNPWRAAAAVGTLVGWTALLDLVFLWRARLPLPDSLDLPLAAMLGLPLAAVMYDCLLRPDIVSRPADGPTGH